VVDYTLLPEYLQFVRDFGHMAQFDSGLITGWFQQLSCLKRQLLEMSLAIEHSDIERYRFASDVYDSCRVNIDS
jgi:hypothetical protein